MAQHDIPTHPALGVTIANNDDKATMTIMTKPPSDDTRALWYAAYARLRERRREELVDFEEQACIVFRLLQRSSSSNVRGRFTMTGLHNLAPNTVLHAVDRWISEARAEEGDEEERDKVCRALTSTKTKLSRNIQESPNAHLAWIAACLCIQKLVRGPEPTCEAPWLAYIVARIAFYDRLPQVISKAPRDDEQGSNCPHEFLVDLYSTILEQLVVVLALDYAPRETRRQKQKTVAHLNVGVNSAVLHPITALEFSLGFHARDKTLEKSVAELMCLRAPSLAILGSNDRDALEAANDTMTAEGGGGGGGDNRDADNDFSHPAYREVSNANATSEHNSCDRSISSEVRQLLCVSPVKPPPLLPPSQLPFDGLKSVLGGLRRWALKQDAYQRWHKARNADHGDSNDRILWLHGPEGSSMALLLHALAQAETENQTRRWDPEWPPYAVACASWDWSRDVNGMSVVSVLRDLIWTVLTAQPTLQKHLANAVRMMGRGALLGGNRRHMLARYATLGTSGDFYAMLTLLCSIVSDREFAPTCFVVDYREMLWDDDDDDGHIGDQAKRNESCKEGRDGSASTAQKRSWTLRDLMELVCTTCRLSGKVVWVVRSMSCIPPSSSIGGCHLYPPEEPVLSEIMHDYIRALMEKWNDSRYTPEIREQLASKLTSRAGGNVAWATLAVDLVARARFSWNAIHVLQRLPDSSAGLGPLLDCIIQSNASDSDSDSDRALLNAALSTAALAFQPLTVPELAALAGLPATVDAASFLDILARPLLEFRDVYNTRGNAKKYVYFPSRAVLAAQRARLAKASAAPDLHADMVCRHLRQLTQRYSHPGHRPQLSLYMKIAWLRHLDHVGVGIGRTGHRPVTDLLTAEVRDFVAQNASAWLHDVDELGVLPVVCRMLQDLLPSSRELGRLSPTQAALNTLITRILRSQEMGISVTKYERFMHIAGCENHDDDGDLPVLPQSTPMLPPLSNSTTAFIGRLKGDYGPVRATHFAFDGRLIVSVSDDDTLQIWDRASCTIQHVALHEKLVDFNELVLSPTDSSLVVAGGVWGISTFDLAIGGVQVETITFDEIVAKWHNQQKEQEKQNEYAVCNRLGRFSNVRFAVDGSKDLIVTWHPHACDHESREVVLSIPGFDLKEVRRTAMRYKSLPTVIKDALPESECLDASVADNVGLAAVVHNDGNLLIYNTKLVERQQTLHWAQRRFARVRYDSNTRAFVTWDERDHVMLHLVYERGDQLEQVERGEHGEREPTKLSYRPLIRSHSLPHPHPNSSLLSFRLSSERDEIVLTFAKTDSCQIYRLLKADADTRNNVAYVDNISHINSPRKETTDAPSPFTSTLFSHDGLRAATSNRNGQVQLWSFPKMATSESETSNASATTLWRTMSSGRAESAINWLSFSSDDTLLLACYKNGRTVVWDTKTCKRVAVMETRRQAARFAAISPTNALVVTVPYADEPIRFWDLEACRYLHRNKRRIAWDINEGRPHRYVDHREYEDFDNCGDDGDYGDYGDDGGVLAIGPICVDLMVNSSDMTSTPAFSPDGRFFVISGSLVHIWDLSTYSQFGMSQWARVLKPDATLYWKDSTTRNAEEAREKRRGTKGIFEDNGRIYRLADYRGDDDKLGCSSFVFSPDNRSLFGFRHNGRVIVWGRTPNTLSPVDENSDIWKPEATVLAGGFSIPGQGSLWTYKPHRLYISPDETGGHLLHTEIGVWELPSLPGDDKVGLRPSRRHPCSVVEIGGFMSILWQNRLLTMLPQIYRPSPPDFSQCLACDIHTVNRSESNLLIGTRTGHLLCFRFQGKEQTTNASEQIDSA